VNFTQAAILLASVATILGASSLIAKAANKRIRLLAFSVSLLTLCQLAAIFGRSAGWRWPLLGRSLEVVELTAGALSLCVVHLLNRENRDRGCLDSRLRVLEPLHMSNGLFRLADSVGEAKPGRDKRKALRFRMHAHATLHSPVLEGGPLPCEVRDISQGGLGLLTARPLPIHGRVNVHLGDSFFPARVVRCQQAGSEHSVGLVFDVALSREQVNDLIRRAYMGIDASKAV